MQTRTRAHARVPARRSGLDPSMKQGAAQPLACEGVCAAARRSRPQQSPPIPATAACTSTKGLNSPSTHAHAPTTLQQAVPPGNHLCTSDAATRQHTPRCGRGSSQANAARVRCPPRHHDLRGAPRLGALCAAACAGDAGEAHSEEWGSKAGAAGQGAGGQAATCRPW